MVRTRMLLVAGAAATLACGVSLAQVQACGVGTSFVLGNASGPPDSGTTATGVGFNSGTVTIHWATPSGHVLTTTTGPAFSKVPIVIPNVAPGLYYVDAWDGTGLNFVAATFRVTATPPAPPALTGPGSGSSGSTTGPQANGTPTTTNNSPVLNSGTKAAPASAPHKSTGRSSAPLGAVQPVSGSTAVAPAPAGAAAAPGAGTAPQAAAAPAAQPQAAPVGIWRQITDDLTSGFQPSRATVPAASPAAEGGSTGPSGALIAMLVTVPALAFGGLGLVAARRRARRSA